MKLLKAFILTAIVLTVGVSAQPVAAQAQADEGKIAFVSDRDGNSEIYVMNSDGFGQIPFTNNGFYNTTPSWSPDGTRIAYVSNFIPADEPKDHILIRLLTLAGEIQGPTDIFVMNSDGSGLKQLTDTQPILPESEALIHSSFDPTWSPDGRRIAFSILNRPDQINSDTIETLQGRIYRMSADGSDQVRLLDTWAWDPSWSPDGQRIAFISREPAGREIFVMKADGSDPTQLTDNSVWVGEPGWSPDGRSIAFSSELDGNKEIYVMNADGTGLTQLTYTARSNQNRGPSWSPDGQRIAFSSDRDGDFEIFVMNVDGSDQTQITHNSSHDIDPHWGPSATNVESGITPIPLASARQTPTPSPTPAPPSAVTPPPSPPPPTPAPEPTPERGFFVNSLPSQASSGNWDLMDPVALSIIGIALTLVGTLVQLFRGR